MTAADQSDTVAFLMRLLAGEGRIERIDTHISTVLMAGDRVLKLKRAVRFPFLDFTTPERRLAACEAELAVNRRTAPSLYRRVHRITRGPDGDLVLDGPGPLVDALVEMRRFPQADLFDRMACDGRLTPALVADLAHRLAGFHAAAPASRDHGGAAAMADLIALNDRSLRASGLVPDGEAAALAAAFRARLARHAARLDARRAAGRVRRCHGDLTLRNICLFEGVPTPFDALEFDEDLATTDILYDLAFVLMDLWHRGRPGLANLLFNRYLDETDDAADAGLMPFLMALRAVIRAHVSASQASDAAGEAGAALRREAQAYLSLARELLAEFPATLVAIGGFSGTGKSTLSSATAPWLGAPPGARIVGSDRIRKRLHGVSPLTRLPPAAYAAEVSEAVYAALRAQAAGVLAGGAPVIVDAVFDRPAEREAVAALAAACGAAFRGVWLEAPVATLGGRIAARRDDPSDATPDILAAQARRDCGTITWRRLDARLAPETLRAMILAADGAGPAPDPA
jgi:aminoglycoside phosphotransferase family enzyme/predicted kinase